MAKMQVDSDVMRAIRQTALAAGAEVRRREVRRGHVTTNTRRKKKVLPATTVTHEESGRSTGEGTAVSA